MLSGSTSGSARRQDRPARRRWPNGAPSPGGHERPDGPGRARRHGASNRPPSPRRATADRTPATSTCWSKVSEVGTTRGSVLEESTGCDNVLSTSAAARPSTRWPLASVTSGRRSTVGGNPIWGGPIGPAWHPERQRPRPPAARKRAAHPRPASGWPSRRTTRRPGRSRRDGQLPRYWTSDADRPSARTKRMSVTVTTVYR
jgi:hypothetical protein